MREPTPTQSIRLTDQQTLHDTMIVARRHIPLTANGYRCQTGDLWRLLLAAAARRTTIEAACADLTSAPDANTVRGYLTEQLTPAGIVGLEQQWNSLLRTLLPDWLRTRPQEVALDFHDEPYYGRDHPDDPDNWVCRGEARAGTTRFYRCATAYLMLHDVRLTLAVVFVKPKMDKLAILKRLLGAVQAARRYLERRHIPAIIAMPIRGKQAGSRRLCRGSKSYRTT
jgi:hypothetical protein